MEANVNFSEEKYPELYIEKLLDLTFAYYDHHNDKEKYESDISKLINEYTSAVPEAEIKAHIKFLIDFIGKYAATDTKFIESSLASLKMKPDHIDRFKALLGLYVESIEVMKEALIEKITSHRVVDFSHSFYVKFCDSTSDKVTFAIRIMFKYYDDNEKLKTIELDLSLNQFYNILNELQKIDTMIKTLI